MTETVQRSSRNEGVDLVRGLAMVLMALDHTRDFFGNSRLHALDVEAGSPALFFTRWITHFCAPIFVFLAGTAAFLSSRRKSQSELSGFLFKRGVWLIVLELTVVRFAWIIYLGPRFFFLQVIWAIGWSMIVLALLVRFPARVSAVFGIVLIAGHNLLDGIPISRFGSMGWLWSVLHVPSALRPFPGAVWYVAYPLVPWIGVMAAGYAFGSWMIRERAERRRLSLRLGAAMIVAFIVLRATNLYGDPDRWTRQASFGRTVLSFINCDKYPPSLLYLLMTLGPALCALAWFDRPVGRAGQALSIFGRVPLFYYVLHLLLIHWLAIALLVPREGAMAVVHRFMPGGGLGFSLAGVYAVWLFVVAALYPACRWFAGVKQRRTDAWLSYL